MNVHALPVSEMIHALNQSEMAIAPHVFAVAYIRYDEAKNQHIFVVVVDDVDDPHQFHLAEVAWWMGRKGTIADFTGGAPLASFNDISEALDHFRHTYK